MCQDSAVFSAADQMIVVLTCSPRGLSCDDSALGVGGEHRTVCCSIVCVPKQCVYGSSTYRESLCVVVGMFFFFFLQLFWLKLLTDGHGRKC